MQDSPAFSVPLPIAHVDGTVPFPDSIRKRDELRIRRYRIKSGCFSAPFTMTDFCGPMFDAGLEYLSVFLNDRR